jgi:uncharacterized protein YbjT (DUF2867 family)
MTDPILVLGGNGKTGRRVAERLAKAGHATRIGSRAAPIPFDWENRATWGPALHGVQSVYVSFQPDLAVPGALEIVSSFFVQALGSGVEKLVLLSGRGEEEAQAVEAVLQATPADWTIIRSSWFSQIFSESFLLDPIRAGKVTLPQPLAAEPFVDVEDIADIAFEALTTDAHSRQLYELTGPRALTFHEAIEHIALATGRTIELSSISMSEYRDELVRQQLPPEYLDLVMYLFSHILDGRNTPLTDGVQRALGRPPRSFTDYLKRAAASGVWEGNAVRA